jgi:ribosomal protein L37AE/L43A
MLIKCEICGKTKKSELTTGLSTNIGWVDLCIECAESLIGEKYKERVRTIKFLRRRIEQFLDGKLHKNVLKNTQ